MRERRDVVAIVVSLVLFVYLYVYGAKVTRISITSKFFDNFLTKFLIVILEMDGEQLKKALADRKISISEAARRLGIAQSTLSAALQNDDVRTGLLEGIAEVCGTTPAYFYTGESSGSAVVGTANQSTVIGKQDGGTRALERQLEVKDDQIDRLLKIIENLNGI